MFRHFYAGVGTLVVLAAAACGGSTALSFGEGDAGSNNGSAGEVRTTVYGTGSGGSGRQRTTGVGGGSVSPRVGFVSAGGAPVLGGGGSVAMPGTGGAVARAGTGGAMVLSPSIGGSTNTSPAGTGGAWVELPSVVLPSVCEPMSRSGSSSGCYLEFECDGDWVWAQCDSWGTSDSECYCSATNRSYSLQLSGVNPATSCEYVAAICMGSEGPVFSAAPSCSETYQSTSESFCQSETECVQTASLSGEASIVSLSHELTDCQLYDGTWNCSCYSDVDWDMSQFGLPGDVNSSVVCPVSRAFCSGEEVIVPQSEMACVQTHQSANSSDCYAEFECEQLVGIGGTSVDLHKLLGISCIRNETSGWDCGCTLGSQSAHVAIDAATTAWNACADAAPQCLPAAG